MALKGSLLARAGFAAACVAQLAAAQDAGKAVVGGSVASECSAAGCLIKLSDQDFETFVGAKTASCIVFYQPGKQVWEAILPELEELARMTTSRDDLGFAAFKIEHGSKVAHRTAATGPISIKLFDRRLRTENYHDIYSLHQNGPRLRFDRNQVLSLLEDYVANSTGLAEFDTLATAFAGHVLKNNEQAAQETLAEARSAAQTRAGSREFHVASAYVDLMAKVFDSRSVFAIAKAFNNASLRLGEANLPTASETRLPLAVRAALLLEIYISGQLSKPLIGDDGSDHVPSYKRRVGNPTKPFENFAQASSKGSRSAQDARLESTALL